MTNEWMKVMLEEILRKQAEEKQARIEEELVVTANGCEVITLFPAQELPIANRY